MLKLPEDVRMKYDVSSLNTAVHAAAPCPVPIKDAMIAWWGPVLREYYAGTEGQGITFISSEEWLTHKGSVGRPLNAIMHICNEDGDNVPVGQEGTVFFESAASFSYHNDPEKTKGATNKHGWTTLGDVGRMDEEGYLYLTDRKSFMIISGGVNLITGGDALGPLLTAHPDIDKITFTGSTATGKRVMESASKDLKRITLELGGNDAAIVLPDADVGKVAEKLFWASFYNAGQVCIAAKRIYIHEDIYDELSGAIAAYAKAVKVGDGAEQGTAIGPIQNKPQYKRVLELIQDAKDKGYKFLAGGDHDPSIPGYFVPVTVLDNPPEDARIVAEEQFGPVMPLMKFSTINEVISRANASDYGLAGSIWTSNPEAAVEVAEQLETGTVWINESMHLAPNAPFAGHKQSGFGAELGEEGLLEFTYPQVITIAREAA
jgi:hypothetical protein